MLQVSDFRETKIYQEAFEEGVEKGVEKGRESGIEEGMKKGMEQGKMAAKEELALRLLAEKFPVATIVKVTGLSAAAVKRLQKKPKT